MKGLLALVALTLVGLFVALYFHLGASMPVTLSEGEFGPFLTVSKKHTGAYHKIVPVIEEVERWAKQSGESCALSFGEYIDDPDKVVEDRLQSYGGCIVGKPWGAELPEGFAFREIARRRYVTAEFDGAPSIGPIKVYPKARDFIQERHLKMSGPVIEMYEILPDQKVKTRYYFPVVPKQSSGHL